MSKKMMLWVLSVLILLAMLSMAVAGKSRFPLVNKGVALVVLPLENGLTALGHGCDSIRDFWKALTVLQRENEELKKENAQLRFANIHMASMQAENLQLRGLLNYKEQHVEQELVAAKVIARNFGQLRDCIYIDAGLDKGLKQEMAVINNGMVGIVDEVYEDYARVLLLTSSRCRVGARVLRHSSRAIGITTGNGMADGQLKMEHIYREANIQEGDIIVTSGYSGSHPEDILIGKVVATSIDEVGLLREATVQPTADISDVEHVLVVTKFVPVPRESMLRDEGGRR